MLLPATINFTLGNGLAIYQGSRWLVSIGITDGDAPFDLSGYTGKCTLKVNAGDDIPICEPDVIINDAEKGLFSISLSSDTTALIPTNGTSFYDFTTYQYDLYFIDENGEYYRSLQGFVDVSPTVTQEND